MMTDFEKREKRIEIFGEDYPEHVSVDINSPDNETLEDICGYAHKGYDTITIQDVLDYIKETKPMVYKDFAKCWAIARDSIKHGRFWTPNNELRKLMERDDISIYERMAMYGLLISALGLDYEEEKE